MNPNEILYGCINTYGDLRTKGQAMVDMMGLLLRTTVEPLRVKLEYSSLSDSSSVSGRRFGPKIWQQIKSQLLRGELCELSVFHFSDLLMEEAKRMHMAGLREGQPDSLICRVGMFFLPHDPSLAGSLEFSIQRRPFDGLMFPEHVQDALVTALTGLCDDLCEQSGFVTIGRIISTHPSSADEEALGYPYSVAARHLRQYVRGANWGNFLAPTHVQALGGAVRVSQEAPCYLVKLLPNGGAYLQLTEDVNQYGEEELARLRQFLQPVLPPKWVPESRLAEPVSVDNPEPAWRLSPDDFSEWPDIGFSIRFGRALTEVEQRAFKDIVLAWFTVGVHQGFPEGALHAVTGLDFEESDALQVSVDCGSCSPSAIEVLERILKSACRACGVGIKSVEVLDD